MIKKYDEFNESIIGKTKELLKQSKYEFLFDTILNKIHTSNPTDNLSKTSF